MNCKKILAEILSAAMVFTTMAIPAFADDNGSVASIGATSYRTLTDAITAAKDNDTVKLLSDVTESITVENGKNITLDLNGKTLTNEADKHTITNNGTLTIKDSSNDKKGTVDNVSNGRAALINDKDATATLNGGTFMRSKEAGTYAPYKDCGNSHYTIKNSGTMSIYDGVTVENAGGFSSNIVNVGEGENKASLTIYNGVFSGGVNSVKNDAYGVLKINNGEFSNTVQYCIMNWDVASISGGKFNGSNNVDSVYNGSYTYTDKDTKVDFTMIGDLTITGGTFTGAIVAKNYNGQAKADPVTSISGGTFDTDVTDYCAYGHEITKSNGTYTVKESNITWKTDTDSGIYTVEGKDFGMMRFMFGAKDVDAVTNIGIKYIKLNTAGTIDSNGKKVEATVATGTNAVQGDIYGMETTDTNNYYAAAFITVGGKTHWSAPISCKLNTAQKFTKYAPTTPAGGEN